MLKNFALYSRIMDSLPRERMQVLADDIVPEHAETERGPAFTYRWPDLTIIVRQMPGEEIAKHLRGFEGYIRGSIYHGNVPERGELIIQAVRATRLVVGVVLQPGWDDQDRSDELLGRMSGGLRPIIFHSDSLFDWSSRLMLAPDGSFDPEAELG